MDTDFMALIVGFLENLRPSSNLLTNDKEGDLDIDGLQEGQELTSDLVWSIIETLKVNVGIKLRFGRDHFFCAFQLTVPQIVLSVQWTISVGLTQPSQVQLQWAFLPVGSAFWMMPSIH